MSIQIFGTKKCFDTKKAQRFFKERRIKFQFIDLKEKEMSKGEFSSVVKSCGINDIINEKSKDYKKSNLDKIRSNETKMEIVFNNQSLLKTPIVRSGQKAAAGFDEDKWEKFIE